MLLNHGQEVLYLPGRLVSRTWDGYRGEGRTDARDACAVADQARMRRDLRPVRPADEVAIELKLLTGRRADLPAEHDAVRREITPVPSSFGASWRALPRSTCSSRCSATEPSTNPEPPRLA
ncbi:transposase [Streptomyces sp. NPDC008222]|uniref:IS110 family transposase n=1 Tax=Streptomyces sp. NPDC008222 TaxID=3364820 RepID=UPI0036F171BB